MAECWLLLDPLLFPMGILLQPLMLRWGLLFSPQLNTTLLLHPYLHLNRSRLDGICFVLTNNVGGLHFYCTI